MEGPSAPAVVLAALALMLVGAAFGWPASADLGSCSQISASFAFDALQDTDADGRYDGVLFSAVVRVNSGSGNYSGLLRTYLELPPGEPVHLAETPYFAINNSETYAWSETINLTEYDAEGYYTVHMLLAQVGIGFCQDGSVVRYLYPRADVTPTIARITGDLAGLPGAALEYNFTLTNIGNFQGTYLLSSSSENWTSTSVVPSMVRDLGPGNSTVVTLRVTVPAGAPPLSIERSNVVATSTSLPPLSAVGSVLTRLPPNTYGIRLSAGALLPVAGLGVATSVDARVHNDGNYADLPTITSSAVPNGWAIDFPGFPEQPIAPGASVGFAVRIRAPLAFGGQLTWNATVTVTASNGVTSAFSVFTRSIAAPDLAFTNAAFSITPDLVAAGAQANATVVVRNFGNAGASHAQVELHDGPTVLSQTVDVPAGAAVAVYFSWFPELGDHQVRAQVDGANRLAELNEDNNVATATVRVTAPDLVLTASDVQFDDYATVGETVAIEVSVRNRGEIRAWNVSVVAFVGAEAAAWWETPGIEGGAAALFTLWLKLEASSTVVSFTADLNSTVAELDENNNRVQRTVHANYPPVAHLAIGGDLQLGNLVQFLANQSADADGLVSQFLLDFGDGATTGWVNHSRFTHIYQTARTFVVTLRVRDDLGVESAPLSANVTVVDPEAEGPLSTRSPLPGPGLAATLGALAAVAAAGRVKARRPR